MIVPVILCGGAGKRLWPLSRPHAPKPVLKLLGDRSMLGLTLDRVSDRTVFAPPLIVTGDDHSWQIGEIVRAATGDARLMVEPAGRDTAPAIAAAALAVDPEALILVLPADHLIAAHTGFRATVARAVPLAEDGHLVVFGIPPDGPSTAFGYIRPGEPVGESGRKVDAYREKPDAATAERLVAEGYLWNGGMFLMRAGTILQELGVHAPAILAAVRSAMPADAQSSTVIRLGAEAFAACPRGSIDYAVMEPTSRGAVVEAAFDWNDVGTWSSVLESAETDGDGNAIRGDATVVDTRNSLVISERPKVGVIGLDDAVVIASDEAVLVTNRASAGRVKDLVAVMEKEPERNFGDFVRHSRPWGNYQTLDFGEGYQTKRLTVHPGKRLSLQKHRHRAEHWTVVQGVAEVTIDERTIDVRPNESVHIPLGAVHRLANHGDTPVVVIEVQCGDYLGEDDIVRLQDDFGREA